MPVEVLAVWYAYASHCALSNFSNGTVASIEQLSLDPFVNNAGRVPGRVSRLPGSPGLPEGVITYDYAANVGVLPSGRRMTNTLFSVDGVTNAFGLTLPARATVRYHKVTRQEGSLHTVPFRLAELLTTSVERGARLGDYPPALEGRYMVSDYRYADGSVRGVVTPMTTNRWPENVQAAAEFRRRAARDRLATRVVIYVLLGATVLAPLVWWRSRSGPLRGERKT
jgi:hypothetical protein